LAFLMHFSIEIFSQKSDKIGKKRTKITSKMK
jgi:hypothetical protein